MSNLIAINKSNGIEREVTSEYLGSTEIHTVSEKGWLIRVEEIPKEIDGYVIGRAMVDFSESILLSRRNSCGRSQGLKK